MSDGLYCLSINEDITSRENKEEPSKYRSMFIRDKDRVLYSKAFRRLMGKTQVFLSCSDDHIRNRLTHTLEVSEIAKITARALNLNEDLTEAIALGHDLGHTPFGHVGERVLSEIMCGCHLSAHQNDLEDTEMGFKHNLQGLRVVRDLVDPLADSTDCGLNLTVHTLYGIKNHSKSKWNKCNYCKDGLCTLTPHESQKVCTAFSNIQSVGFYSRYNNNTTLSDGGDAWSFESFIVDIADEIAQRNHDIIDGLSSGIIEPDEVIEELTSYFSNLLDDEDKDNLSKMKTSVDNDNKELFVTNASRFIVNLLNKNLIITSQRNMNEFCKTKCISTKGDFTNYYIKNSNNEIPYNLIGYEEEFKKAEKQLSNFLKTRILNSFHVQRMDGKGRYIIIKLFKAYLSNPQQLPDKTIKYLFKFLESESILGKDIINDINIVGKLREEMERQLHNYNFQRALKRVICDYISGMTDNFAIAEFNNLYGHN